MVRLVGWELGWGLGLALAFGLLVWLGWGLVYWVAYFFLWKEMGRRDVKGNGNVFFGFEEFFWKFVLLLVLEIDCFWMIFVLKGEEFENRFRIWDGLGF